MAVAVQVRDSVELSARFLSHGESLSRQAQVTKATNWLNICHFSRKELFFLRSMEYFFRNHQDNGGLGGL